MDAQKLVRAPCLFLRSRIRTGGYIYIVAESFRPHYTSVQSTLMSLAEPVSRPPLMHEYRLTPFSLGAAVSNGVVAEEAMRFLEANVYNLGHRDSDEYEAVKHFIESCMGRYNLARVVIERDQVMVQCRNAETAEALLQDAVIRSMVLAPLRIQYATFSWNDVTDSFPFFLLQSRAMAKVVAARCVLLGIPIHQQYEFELDESVRTANLRLRPQAKPRAYQVAAVEAATTDGTLSSGCLLLPCGAGKTLVGIMLMCKVKKPTLVVCASSVSVEQWKNQILEYALLEPRARAEDTVTADRASNTAKAVHSGAARIACLTGKQKDDINDDTDVVLTTYAMLMTAHRGQTRRVIQMKGESVRGSETHKKSAQLKEKLFAPYGLMILDEVHMIPAEAFRESLNFVDAKGVVGLTATYVREDKKILDLFHLVGPKLYDVSMEALTAQGYLAKVNCTEVHVPMTREFGMEYLERSAQTRQLQRTGRAAVLVMLAAANPNKMLCVQELVGRHLENGSKILLFCDHLMLLTEYAKLLHAPVISGATQHKDRLMIFSDFQSTTKVNVVCVSRVGDVSVNLPSANVVIQVSSHGGSRRQEAQRLGRILRPKDRASNGRMVEAWFYSIISTDTLEMAHAAHRTAFLVDQGYTCRIIAYHPEEKQQRDGTEKQRSAPVVSGEVKRAKESPVGDLASIKQESLQNPLLRQQRRGLPAARLQDDFKVWSLSYQLQLLSKVVSSWELEFQRESRKRRHASTAAGGGESNKAYRLGRQAGHDNDNSVTTVAMPPRSYSAIKKEWNEQNSGVQGSRAAGETARLPLHTLVGVDDSFVYHEL